MFSAEQIKDLMNANPFRPFCICMSDGTTCDLTNHNGAMVARNSIDVNVNHDNRGIAERFVRCAIIRITRIKELQPA